MLSKVIGEAWRTFLFETDCRKFYWEIFEAYATPQRHYHTLDHVEKCLGELWPDGSGIGAQLPLALAIVFHDVIMEFGRSDNEERSAEFARAMLERMGAPASVRADVVGYILATKHAAAPESIGAKLAVDADLAILGQGEAEFWEYERRIRSEYAFVPEEVFRPRRAEILRGFLERPQIYATECFRSRYEERARENLRQSIAKLTQ